MIPYIHPKFVEALTFRATDSSDEDTSPEVSPKPSARKRKDRLAQLRRIAIRIRSVIVVVVTNKLILLLI
jgi:hypothetical protein